MQKNYLINRASLLPTPRTWQIYDGYNPSLSDTLLSPGEDMCAYGGRSSILAFLLGHVVIPGRLIGPRGADEEIESKGNGG